MIQVAALFVAFCASAAGCRSSTFAAPFTDLVSETMISQAADNSVTDSGVVGQIVIRPVRPHESFGVPNYRPYEASVRVLDENGKIVRVFRSNSNGNFRVDLPPGKYTLQPEVRGLYPRASEQSLIVTPHRFTELRIVYDTGIR